MLAGLCRSSHGRANEINYDSQVKRSNAPVMNRSVFEASHPSAVRTGNRYDFGGRVSRGIQRNRVRFAPVGGRTASANLRRGVSPPRAARQIRAQDGSSLVTKAKHRILRSMEPIAAADDNLFDLEVDATRQSRGIQLPGQVGHSLCTNRRSKMAMNDEVEQNRVCRSARKRAVSDPRDNGYELYNMLRQVISGAERRSLVIQSKPIADHSNQT